MTITDYLHKVMAGTDLSVAEMSKVMDEIMAGTATPAQVGAFLVALRLKGEHIGEVTGAAMAMRRHAAFIDAGPGPVIDTCGTGGDGADTFNISTTAAFIAAGAGVTVAKHGNRGVSSRCGSADVLAELGFNLDVAPAVMEHSIQTNGIGFLFAQKMHPAMKNVAPIRRELGVRTIFNMLGPLTNPAGASGQLLGVFSPDLTEMFAGTLRELGCRRAMVVHGLDGLDEITCTTSTRISELRDGIIKTYELFPEMVIGTSYDAAAIKGGDIAVNARILRDILAGKETGAPRAIAVLNAAAAIVVGEKADSLPEGLKLAEQALDSGAAYQKLQLLIEASQS
ncbi:MAG: anthranilate phosphoribosyltransferase [Victivallales bacterium]|nr:anthranilate phosphoribosyltransferase [Victivallales bacterium]